MGQLVISQVARLEPRLIGRDCIGDILVTGHGDDGIPFAGYRPVDILRAFCES